MLEASCPNDQLTTCYRRGGKSSGSAPWAETIGTGHFDGGLTSYSPSDWLSCITRDGCDSLLPRFRDPFRSPAFTVVLVSGLPWGE